MLMFWNSESSELPREARSREFCDLELVAVTRHSPLFTRER